MAVDLPGKLTLIGVTYLDADQKVIEQKQFYGRFQTVDAQLGIQVRLEGKNAGEIFRLPPDMRSIHKASPGQYRLRSTEEVVVDRDYLAEWAVYAPSDA